MGTVTSRNLYSVLLERDVGSAEFDLRLTGAQEPPALTLKHLEKRLNTTKASVVVWSHRGSGADVLGPLNIPFKRTVEHEKGVR